MNNNSMFYKTIIRFLLLLICLPLLGQKNLETHQLMDFTKQTINDYFKDMVEIVDTIYFLPDVKNQSGKIIFSLDDLDFNQPKFIIAPENKIKHQIPKNNTAIVHHLIVDDSKKDTLDVNIEEFELAYKKFFIFGKSTRYWICKAGGPDYMEGRYVHNLKTKEWNFISGREKTEQYWERLLQSTQKTE